ncbi:hypothetical protein OM076_26485 [Solirubrobacter ginsenosidimutans]|uniref:Uncharacterized protein n=1 Tax=Solirubrobacter ginsenosidimutans TaxID=490573 RepID=A0A9X3S565_9ACTN|nr:hypothetical protein [Solirubrobacter ginsenosidimutans]MDA0163846.1 hypothetical protein [Solirubrobacter ginsenosidimutans]
MFAIAAPSASAATACAKTTDPATPAAPSPGKPCWVDITPYPFGTDGLPVDTSSLGCPAVNAEKDRGYQSQCYLRVTSMAFRAWNRGLAATTRFQINPSPPPTPFGVWLFNGTRWYPDPTFPGASTCYGDTVVWAGKLDYWLIGGSLTGSGVPTVCRYDGSSFAWQPLEIPAETRVKVLSPEIASVRAGACYAWDDCWFFGPEGVRLHWDGTKLNDDTPDISSPSLRGRFGSAAARVDADGHRIGVAVRWTSHSSQDGVKPEDQVRPDPGESAPAQLLRSDGGAFAPFPFTPPTVPGPDDPWRTNLVAVDLDPSGRGWVAGNTVGAGNLQITGRILPGRQAAPVVPFALSGRAACTPSATAFTYAPTSSGLPDGQSSYIWNSLSVFPDSGDALAGGTERPAVGGTSRNDNGYAEPVLTRVGCAGAVTETRFREPDPTTNDAAVAPANYRGSLDAVAANAANDAWAATSSGSAIGGGIPTGVDQRFYQRPHLYRLTDTAKPAATAGDDVEDRPFEVVADPPIFVEDAPPPEPPPAPDEPPVITTVPTKPKRVKQKPSIYSPKVSKPRRIKGNRYVMVVTFRVRRPVTVGVQALRKNKVVSRSGLKRFKGKRGTLKLEITRKHWPTRVRFYTRSGSTR